jgi:hypothetical protein
MSCCGEPTNGGLIDHLDMRFQLSKYLHITKGFGKVGVKEMGY